MPDNNISSEKTKTEKTKIKAGRGITGKKNEKFVKVEKEACSNVSMTQVTTRTRKLATDTKEMDVHTERNLKNPVEPRKAKGR